MSGLGLVLWILLQTHRPDLVSGELAPAPTGQDLAAAYEALEDGVWLGYAVPAVPGSGSCRGVLRLSGGGWDTTEDAADEVSERFVLLTKEQGGLARVHWADPRCRIDADGRTVRWLSEVGAAESAAFLEGFVLDDAVDSKRAGQALRAVAGHDEPGVTSFLESVVESDRPAKVRKQATFWLGAARGLDGVRALERVLEADADERIVEQAVFALHVSDEAEAESRLVSVAREHGRAEARAKALFWLAQEAGRQASSTIVEAVREDPDRAVKERAVFALSQLPPSQGVPLLVEVARDHPDRGVKKKAFFWLGQSGDPKALEFIERVLTESR